MNIFCIVFIRNCSQKIHEMLSNTDLYHHIQNRSTVQGSKMSATRKRIITTRKLQREDFYCAEIILTVNI